VNHTEMQFLVSLHYAAFCWLSSAALTAMAGPSQPFFKAVSGSPFSDHDNGTVVIAAEKAHALNISAFEGSFYTRTSDGLYHYISAGEMAPAAGWSYWERDIHMRFDHWVSHDGMNWTHAGKIYESSGNFDGTDRRGSTWAPMLTYDEESELWHLFYVAYRGSPAYRTPLGLYGGKALHAYTQFDGEIWHSVSTVRGEQGIGGPYKDVGPILDQESLGGFSPEKDSWEGDHGCDMFFPYRLRNGSWVALYGSELGRFPNFNQNRQVGLVKFKPSTIPASTCQIKSKLSRSKCTQDVSFGCFSNKTMWTSHGCRGVFQCGPQIVTCDVHSLGLNLCSCDAGGLEGNWTRLSALNPMDQGFRPAAPGIENPVVIKSMDGRFFIAVYHIYTGPTVGISFSEDGIHWVRQPGDVQLGNAYCGDTVMTACGLVPEPSKGKGVYSLLYTALGGCTKGACSGENVCRAYLVNAAEASTQNASTLSMSTYEYV